MSRMAIRPAHDDDFDAIAAITNHYIATSTIHFAYEPLTAGEPAPNGTAIAIGFRGW